MTAAAKAALLVLACLVLLVATWCNGQASGRKTARERTLDSVAAVLRDSAKVQRARSVADSLARVAAERRADSLDHWRDSTLAAFHRRVRVVSAPGQPLAVSIDSGPPVREIPVELAIPPIVACEQAIPADTARIHALELERDAAKAEARTADDRAANADARARAGHSRIGFKSGILVGVSLTLAVVRLLR